MDMNFALTSLAVLMTIRQVLVEPNPGASTATDLAKSFVTNVSSSDTPLEPEIANIFKENRAQFNKTAKEWTKRYAK
jgi:ubiquitin-protein ligase